MGAVVDRLKHRPPRTATVTLAVDPADAVRWRELAQAVQTAENAADTARDAAETQPDAPHLAAALEAAEGRLADAHADLEQFESAVETVTFHLAGIGPEAIETLIDACPPSKAEKERHKKAALAEGHGQSTYLRFSDRALAPKLLAACCTRVEGSDGQIDEGLSEKDAEQLWSGAQFDNGDRALLFTTCLSLDQRGSRIGDLGKGFAGILPGV